MAADWLVRTHTSAWLRLAGLTAQADALEALPEITDMAQIPSLRGPIEAARNDAAAVWDAVWDAARAAARAKLKPTVTHLQETCVSLVERMIALSDAA